MIAQVQPLLMTAPEYLAWEPEQPYRHEYIEGQVSAMAGGTLPHNYITLNVYSLLRSHLRGTGCRAAVSDARVRVSEKGPYFYPDIVVSCDERDRRARDCLSYPKLIVEVLSPSTAGFDRGDKFRFYRQISTLEEYVLIDAEKVGIDCYRKTSAGKWELTAYPEAAPVLELSSLDFSCPLALVYEEVELMESADDVGEKGES
ncbi:MAG: Uma2 family endonuclease [Cyanobacteria bacterium RI_101]|nr:Uma2 family endonuclease [Cyanobacteria bacterium RI_101]